jgi:hypothetical protein
MRTITAKVPTRSPGKNPINPIPSTALILLSPEPGVVTRGRRPVEDRVDERY